MLLAPLWPQTPPCSFSALRMLERITLRNTMVLFCDNYAIDIKAKGFGEVSSSKITFLTDVVEYLHVGSPRYLEPKRKRDAEGKFVDVETMTKNTPTKAIDQFDQMVVAPGASGGRPLAEGHERASSSR